MSSHGDKQRIQKSHDPRRQEPTAVEPLAESISINPRFLEHKHLTPSVVLSLQRQYGNHFVQRLLRQHKPSPTITPNAPDQAVQRDVGFEFETNWQLRHIPDEDKLKAYESNEKKRKKEDAAKRKAEEKAKAKNKLPDNFAI